MLKEGLVPKVCRITHLLEPMGTQLRVAKRQTQSQEQGQAARESAGIPGWAHLGRPQSNDGRPWLVWQDSLPERRLVLK